MIKVLIADDHNLIIDGIKTTLFDVSGISIVAEANDGFGVLKALEKNNVDIVLMDINMPKMDGLECTKAISRQYPHIKIIALSQYNESRFIKRMIHNGASGYLLKDALKQDLIEAIQKVFDGGQYFSKGLTTNKDELLAKKQSNYAELPTLSEREFEILILICNEYSSPEIAKKIEISFSTVEKHRANLMFKSGTKNTAGLVRWAVENNLAD